ncbi:MAG: hypothetical protein AB7O59_15080 [Pirellulales bacterium]
MRVVPRRGFPTVHASAVATITHGAFTAPSGKIFPEAQNRVTPVLMKGSDGWKIVHCHSVQVDAEAGKQDPVNKPK